MVYQLSLCTNEHIGGEQGMGLGMDNQLRLNACMLAPPPRGNQNQRMTQGCRHATEYRLLSINTFDGES